MDLEMILAGQSTNKDLQNRHVADLHARREPAVSRPDESRVRYDDMLESPEGVGRFANTSKTKLAHFEDVIIDGSHRFLLPSDSVAGRFWLIGGALIAASCWVIISLLPLPFALAPSDKQRESSVSSIEASAIKKGDRLQIPSAVIRAPVSESTRETEASVASPNSSQQPTEVQRQLKGRSIETRRHTTSTTERSRDLESTIQLVPTPDTKPTTTEGWTLREVTNGIALLEGPNGTWRVGRGDTVPGLGRVDSIFRWGSRLMVATSSGLISTP
jgi:hypothetical protein